MTVKKSQFLTRFEKTHAESGLSESYYKFIAGGDYEKFKISFVQGLKNRGPTFTKIKWDDQSMLKVDKFYKDRFIDLGEQKFHPIATIDQTSEFLAIDLGDEKAPVYIWLHDVGEFYKQTDSFQELLDELFTKEQVKKRKAEIRKQYSEIKKTCAPALNQARKLYEKGELKDAAIKVKDALKGREPIPYSGPEDDFKAINILGELYELEAALALANDDLDAAWASIEKASQCCASSGIMIYRILMHAMRDDVKQAYSEVADRMLALKDYEPGVGDDVEYKRDPLKYINHFTEKQQQQAKATFDSYSGTEEEMQFVKLVLSWLEFED